MAERTEISWTDATWSPWTGCTKVSPGCDHCYAESWSKRAGAKVGKWGPGAPRVRTTPANWRKPLQWNAEPFFRCAGCGWRGSEAAAKKEAGPGDGCPLCGCDLTPARRRVFCSSLADVFDNEVDHAWRADLFALIAATPNLDWLLLTKRTGNVLPMVKGVADWAHYEPASPAMGDLELWCDAWSSGKPPSNVWLGATIVNQEEADRDIPKLLATPARVRFLSMEPLLGPVDLRCVRLPADPGSLRYLDAIDRADGARGVDWVIVGGESGPKARPMHPDWARSLRDQCEAAGVAFHFKQFGEAVPVETEVDSDHGPTVYPLDENIVLPGERYKVHEHGGMQFVRVPRKGAGRLLDGKTHDGFPA